MKNIRAVFNYAIDEEVTLKYPFRKFKIKKEQTRKRCLSVEELRLLKNYDVEPYQELYRDIFMLIFYLVGINLEDLLHLTEDNLVRGRIEYRRYKTGRLFSIKVEPEAKAIINKYRGEKYLLNIMDNRKDYTSFTTSIDRALKQIGVGKKRLESLYSQNCRVIGHAILGRLLVRSLISLKRRCLLDLDMK